MSLLVIKINTCREIYVKCCLFFSRKNLDVEEVTIDPEAKWTYSEKKEGTIKPDPEGLFMDAILSHNIVVSMVS